MMLPSNAKKQGGLRSKNFPKTTANNSPLVTIITVVYQGANFLSQTIQSVLEQNYENIEYIIIDGGSSDGTVEIIQQYEDKIDYWVSEPDKGIADAMNKGVKLAQGILINHLHAGDKFADSDVVSKIVSSYIEESWRWCFGVQKLIDGSGATLGYFVPPKFNKLFLKVINTIPHQTVFIEKSLFAEVGYFDTTYKCAMDYHLWLKIAEIAHPKQFNTPITEFLTGGFSSNTKLALLEEMRARDSIIKKSYFLRMIARMVVSLRFLKSQIKLTTFVQNKYPFE